MTGHDLSDLCAPLRAVPADPGDYTIDAPGALRQFGVGETELEALRRAGLQGESATGEPRYARHDLHYLGLRRGLARDVLAGIQLWRTSLERLAGADNTRLLVEYLPNLPAATGQVDGRAVLPGDPEHPVTLRHRARAAAFTVTQLAAWPALPDDVAAIVDELAGYEFCLLPARLLGDTALARRLGLTECWTGSKLLMEACRRIGRRARTATGLMVVLPFSSPHSWAEVEVDGVFTPVDPLIIELMRRWAGLDPVAWPHHRSPGAMLIPLVWDPPAPIPLVSRDGHGVPTTFRTRAATGSDEPAAAASISARHPRV